MSRTATSSKFQVSGSKSEITRDTVREQVVVAVHDTLREVTTITVQLGQTGDTVKVTQVTERDRLRDRKAVKDKEEKLVVHTDTVYIERKDSVVVKEANVSHQTPSISHLLKWIFWIVCAIIVLIIVIKLGLRRSLF